MTGERAREMGLFNRLEESPCLFLWNPADVSTRFIFNASNLSYLER